MGIYIHIYLIYMLNIYFEKFKIQFRRKHSSKVDKPYSRLLTSKAF